MYPAIAATSRAGVIEPLEPVVFEDNEQLVILRLSKPYAAADTARTAAGDWRAWVGRLKDSPNWNDDPLALQREMRREWD
jgi:hypothetical protein